MGREEHLIGIIRETPLALALIDDQTEEMCIAAVIRDAWAIVFVKNQTIFVCKIAIKTNPHVLQFITHQTKELCEEAVKRDGKTLIYVHDQTYRICMAAIRGKMFDNAYEIIKMIRDRAMRNHIAHMYDHNRAIKISPLLVK